MASASSRVSSDPPEPRTPSVPKMFFPSPSRRRRAAINGLPLPLGVLRCPAGFAQTVLLALNDPGVAGQEPGLLQDPPEIGVKRDQGPGDPAPAPIELARGASAFALGVDVETALRIGDLKGLHDPHPGGHCRKIVF